MQAFNLNHTMKLLLSFLFHIFSINFILRFLFVCLEKKQYKNRLALVSYSRLYSRPKHKIRLTEVSVRSLGQVQRAKLASRGTDDSVSKREPKKETRKKIIKAQTKHNEF